MKNIEKFTSARHETVTTKKGLISRNIIIAGLAVIPCINAAQANGLLPYHLGAKSGGMGGAGMAYPKDCTDGDINPALMGILNTEVTGIGVYAHEDKHFDSSKSGIAAFLSGGQLPKNTHSQKSIWKDYLLGGFAAGNYRINPKWTVGVTVAGGGAKSNYKKSIVSPALTFPHKFFVTAGLVAPNLALKVSENQAYGISPIIGMEIVNGDVPNKTFGRTRGFNKREVKFGLGVRIGGYWKLCKDLSLGASASTPVYFQKLKKYHDAIPHPLNVPAILAAGLAWQAAKKTVFVLDVWGTFWGEVKQTSSSPAKKQGFGWKNVLSIKTGIQQTLTDHIIVRAGYAYENTPIPKKEVMFNGMTAGTALMEHTITLGGTYAVNRCLEIDLAGAYGLKKKLRDNGKGSFGKAAKGITLSDRAALVSLGLRWKF